MSNSEGKEKILIVGLGIGDMYQDLLLFDYDVYTVDINPAKAASFLSIEDCLKKHKYFDLSIICTPNYLHKKHAEQLIEYSKIVLVEKPGFVFVYDWIKLYSKKQNLFMTKNNMFRTELDNLKNIFTVVQKSSDYRFEMNFLWLNEDRIPSPGSWFTQKTKSLGGVSKDLIPHLLSLFYYFHEMFISKDELKFLTFKKEIRQDFSLETISNTSYGTLNTKGIYDVDDFCRIDFEQIPVSIKSAWKTTKETKIGIEVIHDAAYSFIPLGLCPEECYLNQFEYFLNITDEQKQEQLEIDLFIHSIIEKL